MVSAGRSAEVTVVPAVDVTWADLQAVFGTRGDPSRCFCQRFRMQPGESWASVGSDELAARLRDQLDDGATGRVSPGLVAFVDGEPVGWCAVDRRSAYPRLLRNVRVPWEGRDEDKADDSVWAVTCFVTRTGYRRRGISHALCRAAVEHARDAGARALEGYPMTTTAALVGELHVGVHSVFVAAGFTEVSRPTPRRAVMRIEL
jgi:GNAT superfamily N-acetyltransferase